MVSVFHVRYYNLYTLNYSVYFLYSLNYLTVLSVFSFTLLISKRVSKSSLVDVSSSNNDLGVTIDDGYQGFILFDLLCDVNDTG